MQISKGAVFNFFKRVVVLALLISGVKKQTAPFPNNPLPALRMDEACEVGGGGAVATRFQLLLLKIEEGGFI